MNKIFLIGRLTQDPDFKYTVNGKGYCRMNLAVDRKYKDKEGKQLTDFIPIIAWEKLAEIVAEYMSKGKQVSVFGSLEVRSYEQNNEKKYIAEVIASEIKFLDKLVKISE